MASTEYNDDRHGMMRVHIAAERGRFAGKRYTRDSMRHWAHSHGLIGIGSLLKADIGWHMAQHGLLDADGFIREGLS